MQALTSPSETGIAMEEVSQPALPTPTELGLNNIVFSRKNILSDQKLREHLGDTSSVDAATGNVIGHYATKKDPKCRFM
jgi:hypothetical protein